MDGTSQERLPISLLKCDVEGAEAAVLHGIDETDWPRIQSLALEVHSSETLKEVRGILSQHFPGQISTTLQQDIPDHHMLYGQLESVQKTRPLKRRRLSME